MKRKFTLLPVILLLAFCFNACESKQIGEAKTAFLEERYSDVILMLDGESVVGNEELTYM